MNIPDGIKKYLGKEDLLHIACANYLKLAYPKIVFFHPKNEGKRPGHVEQYKMKAMGVRSGVHDFIIMQPNNQYHGLSLEAKIKPNKATPSQLEWMEKMKERGYRTAVFYSFDEFKEIIDEYFKDYKL